MTNLVLFFMPYMGPFRGYVESDNHLIPVMCYLILFVILMYIIIKK